MTPTRWKQVRQVLESALEQDPPGLADYLDQACAGDDPLRAQVESLVKAYQKDPSFIERPAVDAIPGFPALIGRSDVQVGQTLGPYQISELIASGGMGAVYKAVRADDTYRKNVAIKVIRRSGFDDPLHRDEVIRRFRAERQLLANLEHPNIAHLLDGGATSDGMPFLVMEFIEGAPIDRFCDEKRLSVGERLRLFQSVCSAVQHAHQKLVVHRDLKPGNILVDQSGAPKLLDFGIAKLLDPDSSALGGLITRTHARPMTPAYASPEQIRGLPITTATDVFSLGVILYELLTGHRPYRLNGHGIHDLPRLICEEEPTKPSASVTQAWSTDDGRSLTPDEVSRTREGRPERLRRRLAGDLDTIVLTALQKEPQRRYASVEQFSEDVRRHLEGEPITARPATLGYRTGKFISRHKFGVVAAGLVVASLAGGMAATARQARIANQRATEANLFSDALTKVLETASPVRDPAGSRRQAQATIAVKDLLARGSGVIAKCRDQPLVQAKLQDTLGSIYWQYGNLESAKSLQEEALEIRRRELGPDHPDTVWTMNHLAATMLDLEEWKGAEALLRQAMNAAERVQGVDAQTRIGSIMNLGIVLMRMGRPTEAEPQLRRAVAEFTASPEFGANSTSTLHAMNNLGSCLLDLKRFADAEAILTRTVELKKASRELGPDHVWTLQSISNLASALFRQDKKDQALAFFKEAYDGTRRVLGNEAPLTLSTANNYAFVLMKTDRWAEAAPICEFVVDTALTQCPNPRENTNVARYRGNYGECLSHLGRCEQAHGHLMAAYQIMLKKFGPNHIDTQKTVKKLQTHFELCGKADEAEDFRKQLAEAASANNQKAP